MPSDNSEREGRRLRLVLLLSLPLLIFPDDFICLFLPFRGDGQDQLTQEQNNHLVSSSSAASGGLQSDGSVMMSLHPSEFDAPSYRRVRSSLYEGLHGLR